ncbi:Hypothetical predicted protein [Cloeon dipterum]|uniref:Major facilitator superfamily (MFS) profile domain-containing protein n=1 Tax=Cloeon dipterum TaxID=197152 RepID=A0A8S1CNU2_9INSE|nr:Hypothetical predicted protein [Cloeon dipterum]
MTQKQRPPAVPALCKPLAPDGGWGWMVVLGVALANMTTQSLVSTFGLLFGQALHDMGQATTGAALVMNFMSATTNLSGLITGPIMKLLSYRQVALIGAVLFSMGLLLSSMATNITHLILTYSILSGLGLGLTGPSSFVALSTYFNTKRGRAVGLALVGTGMGQMLMPQVVRFFLEWYDFSGAMLLLSAISLHAVFAAWLYRPLEGPSESKPVEDPELRSLRRISNAEMSSELGMEVIAPEVREDEVKKVKECDLEAQTCTGRLAAAWNLRLFRDPSFVNIVAGLATFNVANINFSMVLPFLLMDHGLTRPEAALCMSVTAASDIVARLLVPFIKVKHMCARNSLMVAMVALAFTRSLLAMQSKLEEFVVVSVIAGLVRGAAILNLNLVVAEHCCNETLPAALGINMVAKGVVILTIGPLLGWLRDASGSYNLCVHVQSGLLLAASVAWAVELIVKYYQRRR